MGAAIISAVFGSLILAVLGWMIQQTNRLGDRIDRLSDRLDHLSDRIDDLAQRVSRIEGRLDERAGNTGNP
jgi:hypothetical protein